MSTYLKNIIESLSNSEGTCFAIEHKNKRGWFIFDVEQTKTRTEIIWIKDSQICLLWATKEVVEQFLDDSGIPRDNLIITDITKI